jgi:hypothetical protein
VGGPYSSQEDAERAIRSGAFHQNAAELTVMEGDSDDGDPADGTSKTSAFDPFETPATSGGGEPAQPDVPDIHTSMPDAGPMTTKPSQIPGGDMGSGAMPMKPTGLVDDTSPTDMPGPESSGASMPSLGSVVAMIVRANPQADEATIARVATQVMRRLSDFHPYSMMPNIEDPLAHRSPLSDFEKLKKKKDEDDEGGGDGNGGSGGGSSLPPRMPLPNLSRGSAVAGEAEAAESLPLLLV